MFKNKQEKAIAIFNIAIKYPCTVAKIMASSMSAKEKAFALDFQYRFTKDKIEMVSATPIFKNPKFGEGGKVPINKESELIISPTMGKNLIKVMNEIKIDIKGIEDEESTEKN